MEPARQELAGGLKPGQYLVAAGCAGLAGTAAVIGRKREELLQWFSDEYIDRGLVGRPAYPPAAWEQWRECNVTAWEPISEGGVMTALWNLSGRYGAGIRCSLRRIPISQVTVEVCERYDLNPYRLFSDGLLLAADRGWELACGLTDQGIEAAVIGTVIPGIARLIDTGTGTAYLERPRADELGKVWPDGNWIMTN